MITGKKFLCGVIAVATLISPMSYIPAFTGTNMISKAYAASTDTSDLKVYAGKEEVQKYGVEAQGSGAYVTGNIKGTVKCHSMEELYKAYNLSKNANYKVLFARIRTDKKRTVLKKVFENSQDVNLDYDINFILEGNDYDITGVYITLRAVILEYDGIKMKFISNRPNDSGAVTEDGDNYNGYTPL
jgi:hypothetical protein